MNHIKQFPHCDPRILHAPGECEFCDGHPDWQELREFWHIAFTGKKVDIVIDKRYKGSIDGTIFPCPADAIRGDNHTLWSGNVARPAGVQRGPNMSGLSIGMKDGKLVYDDETGLDKVVTDNGESNVIPQADGGSAAPIAGLCATCGAQNSPDCGVCRSVANADAGPICEWCKESGHDLTSFMTMKPFTKVKVEKFWCIDGVACALRAFTASPVGG